MTRMFAARDAGGFFSEAQVYITIARVHNHYG